MQLLTTAGEVIEITPDQARKVEALHQMPSPPGFVVINGQKVETKTILGVKIEDNQVSMKEKFEALGLDLSWMKR